MSSNLTEQARQTAGARSGGSDLTIDAEAFERFPSACPGLGNFDLPIDDGFELRPDEFELQRRIVEIVSADEYELPHIPSSHLAILDLVSNPEVDLKRVEPILSRDLVLTAALLKVANSVAFAGSRPVETVRGALCRVGLHGVRSVLLSLSLKSVIFNPKALVPIAEEVWRQAVSVACNARALAVPLCFDPERYYALGLLHDIGKVPLLGLLRRYAPPRFDFRRSFVGAIFAAHHERIGRELTTSWNLPEEIVAVAGCHHDYDRNLEHVTSAAIVHQAHRQDLYLSSGRADDYLRLEDDPSMAVIGIAPEYRRPLLDAVRRSYLLLQRTDAFA